MSVKALPCSCGGKPREVGIEKHGDMIFIKSKCRSCGKDFRDCFEVKHIARFYDDAPVSASPLKRVK